MSSHCRDVDKNPIASIEVEPCGTLDHQSGHTRRKDHPCPDHGRPASKVDVHCPQRLVEQPNCERSDNPHPALRGVKDDERKVGPVKQVAEVEDFKEASSTDEGKGTNEDDGHNCHQSNACGIGQPLNEAKYMGFCSEDPLFIGPRFSA